MRAAATAVLDHVNAALQLRDEGIGPRLTLQLALPLLLLALPHGEPLARYATAP